MYIASFWSSEWSEPSLAEAVPAQTKAIIPNSLMQVMDYALPTVKYFAVVRCGYQARLQIKSGSHTPQAIATNDNPPP
jgi:hypothetical protein